MSAEERSPEEWSDREWAGKDEFVIGVGKATKCRVRERDLALRAVYIGLLCRLRYSCERGVRLRPRSDQYRWRLRGGREVSASGGQLMISCCPK